MKKTIIGILLVLLFGTVVPYKYDNEKAVRYAIKNVNNRSKCMCAWYVMRAIQSGGCYPLGIYPAYAYSEILLKYGFVEIDNPQKGDIVVLSNNSKHPYGHIAVYDVNKWYSDYKQKSVYPNNTYRNESSVRYFRQSNGWHTANIWVNPIDLIKYVNVFVENYNKIKL